MSGSTISIQDVQAVKLVDIPIQPGTIVVLSGDNGVGKSTAITAVTSAIDGENRGLKPRDGMKAGKVRMPNAVVSFGARMKRTETGDETAVSYVLVEDGTGIRKILSPGLKDVKAADKKRLEGVLDVIGAKLTIAQQKEFLSEHYAGFSAAREVTDMSFVDTVKSMKLYLEEVARGHRVKVDESTGALGVLGDIPADVEVTESVDSLSQKIADLTVATRDAETARASADKALEALNVTSVLKDVDAIEIAVRKGREFIATKEREVADLKESIEEAKSILTRNEALLESEKAAEKQRAAMRIAIDTAPTAESIVNDQAKLEELRELHRVATVASSDNKRRAADRAKRIELRRNLEFAEATWATVKELTHRLPELLVAALSVVDGWSVDEDLQLCVKHTRGEIPFSELSPGEGTAKVCLLATQFAKYDEGDIPVIGLPQECFEGLDAKNRKLLLASVKEHGLCLVAAEATREGEEFEGIRVKVMA